MTDLAATPIEAKKHGLTQRQDGGWTLALNVHPAEMPTWLLSAPMGQRLAVVIAAINDDESLSAGPVSPSGPTTSGSGASSPDAPAAKRKWHQLSPTEQAGIRCADPEFQKWLGQPTAEDAAARIRRRCDVGSRSELSLNLEAARKWREIDDAFLVATGRIAEIR